MAAEYTDNDIDLEGDDRKRGGRGGAGGGKRGFSRRKICRFCADKQVQID